LSFIERITGLFDKHQRLPMLAVADTVDTPFEGDSFMRWFMFDEKVNRCVCINAGFATITSGFNTELQVTTAANTTGKKQEVFEEEIKRKYQPLLDFVNVINGKVNMDTTLFYSVIRVLVHGKMGWLILTNKDSTMQEPQKLVTLPIKVGKDSGLQPKLDKDREITSFEIPDEKVKGKPITYNLKQVLYFNYLDLLGDKQGLSSLYPVLQACQTRFDIRTIHYPKTLQRLWKMPIIAQVDTSGFEKTPEGYKKEQEFMDTLSKAVDSGNNFAVNKNIELKDITLHTELKDEILLEKSKGEEIVTQFGTAPFLVNQLSANYATATMEYDGFINGTVADLQRFLKRELEVQWYPLLMECFYAGNEKEFALAKSEVKIKHVWNPAKKLMSLKEMVEVADLLYNKGEGLCGKSPQHAAGVAGLNGLETLLINSEIKKEDTPV